MASINPLPKDEIPEFLGIEKKDDPEETLRQLGDIEHGDKNLALMRLMGFGYDETVEAIREVFP